jgi:hypothetical protein
MPKLPKLYSTQTGEEITASPEEYHELLRSGRAALLKGEEVPALDPSGRPVAIPSEQFAQAITEGFRLEPLESQIEREKREIAADQPIRAGLEAAARGLTLGLSDPLLAALGSDREEMRLRKEESPIISGVAEFGGAVAPILASGGSGLLAKGGAGAISGAARFAPSALAAEAGTAAAKGAQALLGAEATGIAGRIAQTAIPIAAGSAVEGAIYGAGAQISEATLGDPEQVAEKAIANIGLSAALGGAWGATIGGVFGALSKRGHFISELDSRITSAEQATDVALNAPILSEAERKAFKSGLESVAEGAGKIKEAGEVFGVEVFPEQITGSDVVKRASAILDNSDSPTAVARQKLKQDAIKKVVGEVEGTLGKGLEVSEEQAGNFLKEGLKKKLDDIYQPSKALYQIVEENIPYIDVSEPAKRAIIANIKKMEGYGVKGGKTQQFGDFVINNMGNVKTAKDAQNLARELGSRVDPTNTEQRRIVSALKEKLDDLVENSTIRAAKKLAEETGDKALSQELKTVIDAIPEAKKQYAIFRDKLDTLAKQLGRKRISGKAAFEEFLDEGLKPYQLIQKMYDKRDSRFLRFLANEFPEEAQYLFQYQKTKMLNAAREAGSVAPIFRELDKLSPEVRGIIFSKDELNKLELARKYLDTISYSRHPMFGNPSRTAYTESSMRGFESERGALLNLGRDISIKKLIESPLSAVATFADWGKDFYLKSLIDATSNESFSRKLLMLEDAADKVSKDIRSTARALLSRSAPVGAYAASRIPVIDRQEKPEDNRRFFDKQSKAVIAAISDPEKLVNRASEAYSELSQIAPRVAQSLSAKSAQAAMFLYEKMPKNPNSGDMIFSMKKWYPSDLEISKWKKYVEAVENPRSALRDLKEGKMTHEQADALRNVYPQLYRELQERIIEELPKVGDELPYQKRLQLGILFQIPTDPSLRPDFIQQMQQRHMQQVGLPEQTGSVPSSSRAEHLNDIAESRMSGTEKIVNRA